MDTENVYFLSFVHLFISLIFFFSVDVVCFIYFLNFLLSAFSYSLPQSHPFIHLYFYLYRNNVIISFFACFSFFFLFFFFDLNVSLLFISYIFSYEYRFIALYIAYVQRSHFGKQREIIKKQLSLNSYRQNHSHTHTHFHLHSNVVHRNKPSKHKHIYIRTHTHTVIPYINQPK